MLSAIILTNTVDEEIFSINLNCINSLLKSENWEIIGGLEVILIESNRHNSFIYEKNVKVIVPKEQFNFNRFLNIGIAHSIGQYIALCNNDIIFSPNWFSEILKLRNKERDIFCFSPIDRDYNTMSYEIFPDDKDFYIGWNNKYHFSAWCFVLERNIIPIIGKLDERFEFYSADDDFLMTLRKYAIKNVLVTHSHVKHLSQQVTKKIFEINELKIVDKKTHSIPDKYLKRGLAWLWDDIRFYKAFFIMENKWGDEKMIRRINRLLDSFPILRHKCITKVLYNKQVNRILSKITGI